MGCRRRRAGEQELARRGPFGGLSRASFGHRRRTPLWFWCGVIFFAAFPACGSSQEAPATSDNVLRIGFPEGGVAGAGFGLAQLTSTLTLEGLTHSTSSVDGRALPRLAESWSWENEGRRLRLHLRSGVTFHDGTPLTATLAAEALSRAIARPANRALYSSVTDITSFQPDGELQLVLELAQPSAFLPEDLGLPLSIGPENVGTGAFRLVRRDSDGVHLERFDRYYLGAPEIERIVIRPSDNLRTSWTRLLRGEVDMVTDIPPEAVEFVQNDDIQVISFARSYQFLVAFNSKRSPFTSSAVRRALNTAINRDALITNVLRGQGEPATGPLWPNHWAYDASIPPYSFDPAVAESLLDNAGFTIGTTGGTADLAPARLRFTCLLPEGFSLLERVGLEVQKHLYDIGVDVQFEAVQIDEFNSRISEGRFEAVLVDMISGPTFGRPFLFWRSARQFKGMNVFGYENAETERLFQILRASMNEAAIRSATRRLQRTLLNDPPALFLAWTERARAVSRRFRVTYEADRDPLLTIRQWTENPDREPLSTQ